MASQTEEVGGRSSSRSLGQMAGNLAYAALFLLMFVFAFLFYDSAKVTLALYVGWFLLAFGACMLVLASQSRRKARESNLNNDAVIESGMYAYVRHPEFFSQYFVACGLIFISLQWLSVVTGVVLIAFLSIAIMDEEKRNRARFGEAYERYMQRVPRLNFIAGAIRNLKRKKAKLE